MKALKWIVQVIGAIAFTMLFATLMYYLAVAPAAWFVGLSTFWKIIVLIFFVGIIQGLLSLIQSVAAIPYIWLVKENKLALYVSIALLVLAIGANIFNLWKANAGGGGWSIVFCIISSILLLEVVVMTIPLMLDCHSGAGEL